MRSKRSKAWHLRKETAEARALIEHGVVEKEEFVAFAHPSLEADLRGILTGASPLPRILVRVPK